MPLPRERSQSQEYDATDSSGAETARVELMTAVAVAVVQQQCCASSSGIRVTVAVVCHLCRTLNPKPLAKAPPSPRGRVVVQVRRIGPVLPTSEAAVVIIITIFTIMLVLSSLLYYYYCYSYYYRNYD